MLTCDARCEATRRDGRAGSGPLEALSDAVASVIDTFSIQFGLDLEPEGEPRGPNPPAVAFGSSIALTSRNTGWNMAVICNESTANKLTRLLFAMEEDETPGMDDIADALGEIPNVAAGVFKARRAEIGETLQLGLPIFMNGRCGFQCRPKGVEALAQKINGIGGLDIQVVLSWRKGDEVQGDLEMANAVMKAESGQAKVTPPGTVLDEAVQSVIQCCEVQIGMPLQVVSEPMMPDPDRADFGSTIALTKPSGGWNLSVVCDKESAESLTRLLFALEDDETPEMEDLADALGEIANVAGGNLRKSRVQSGDQVQLGLPLFLEGSGCVEFFASGIQRVAQILQAEDGQEIQVVLIWQGDRTDESAAAAAEEAPPEPVAAPAAPAAKVLPATPSTPTAPDHPATATAAPSAVEGEPAEAPEALQLPRALDVIDFLELLIGQKPDLDVVEEGAELGSAGYNSYISYLLDTDGNAVGAIYANLPGALYLGGGLIMMQEGVLQEQLALGEASEAVIDALGEIFNNLRGLFNKNRRNPHVSPSPVTAFDADNADNSWVGASRTRLELSGNSPYGKANLILLGR